MIIIILQSQCDRWIKEITICTKQRSISRNVQMMNEYLQKSNPRKFNHEVLDLLGEIIIMHSRAELYSF